MFKPQTPEEKKIERLENEITQLRTAFAEAQAREAKLREALDWLRRYGTNGDKAFYVAQDACNTPQDGSALREVIATAVAEERKTITDEWVSRVQSDLEHGVKSLNEASAEKWRKEFPLVSTFGLWLEGELE